MDVKIVCKDPKYLPQYANDTDACLDLKVRFLKEEDDINTPYDIVLPPNASAVLGTGVKVAIPEGYVMFVFPRSSTGIKLNLMLTNTTGVIDAGYRDEIRMAVTNFGNKAVTISDGQRLAQFLIMPRPEIKLVQVEDDEEFRSGDRGGGIGSSGKF